jgi:hypothetical protein
MKLTDSEKAAILDVARKGAQRCREAIVKLQFTDLEYRKEIHRQLEETAKMWNDLAASAETEADPLEETEPCEKLPEVESPTLSERLSEIEMVIGEK